MSKKKALAYYIAEGILFLGSVVLFIILFVVASTTKLFPYSYACDSYNHCYDVYGNMFHDFMQFIFSRVCIISFAIMFALQIAAFIFVLNKKIGKLMIVLLICVQVLFLASTVGMFVREMIVSNQYWYNEVASNHYLLRIIFEIMIPIILASFIVNCAFISKKKQKPIVIDNYYLPSEEISYRIKKITSLFESKAITKEECDRLINKYKELL